MKDSLQPCERFKELRIEFGPTQEKFAAKLGVSKGYVAQIELAERPVAYKMQERINRRCGISKKWIRDGTDPKYVDQIGILPERSALVGGSSNTGISNAIAEIKKEKDTLYIPVIFLYGLESLSENVNLQTNLSPRIMVSASIQSIGIFSDQKYRMVMIQEKTGMEPKINSGDLIMVNLSDIQITEEDLNEDKIYVVRYKGQIVLRYANLQESSGGIGYMLSREGGKSRFVGEKNRIEIVGRVIWVCHQL